MKPIKDEFAVSREVLTSYFEPKIAKSTFYDLVNRGKIAGVPGLRGYYRLNESLSRLGMPPVEKLPGAAEKSTGLSDRALVDIALSICMPDELPAPSELLSHPLTADEVLKISQMQRIYSASLDKIDNSQGRLKFVEGVRDAATLNEVNGMQIPSFCQSP